MIEKKKTKNCNILRIVQTCESVFIYPSGYGLETQH